MELQSLLIFPITIAAFLALLTIIVFIHEYGHFSIARLLGVRVDVFSIGFGKPILQWVDRKGTQWRIAALPLGGYVKFFGDLNAASQASPEVAEKAGGPATTQFPRPGDTEEIAQGMTAEERAVCFHFKPVWARAAIVAAGPVANFILAVAIFASLFAAFGRQYAEPVVGSVLEVSAAQEAGVLPGDRIVAVNGRSIDKFRQIQDAVMLSSGEPMGFRVLRGGAEVELTIVPTRAETEDRYGNPIEVWRLGIGGDPNAYGFEKYGFVGAIREGVKELWRVLSVTTRFLGKIITGKEDAKQLGGPIKMAQYAGQSVMSGFDQAGNSENPSFGTMLRASIVDFISLAAFVSVSIGFLNILPVPVLDGGHLLYYAYEAIAGRPLGARAQAVGFRVGIVLLASLMIFVTWNDINNLISSIS
jgi:regulator of sigma E protease